MTRNTARRSYFMLPILSMLLTVGMVWSQTAPQYPNYPGEIPANFKAPTQGMNYSRRDVMIPMRDGVKLHTVILTPKGVKHAGIILTRTPYSADALTTNSYSTSLASTLWGGRGGDNPVDAIISGGYIFVGQDIRGKYGSQGDFVMNRPFHGPLNPTPVDESTDAYDTIDWLVKNLPQSNGKVCVMGVSYPGFLALAALIHPHPALKCAVPMNPMVDGWRGDDWFHNGAFREQMMPYIYNQEATRGGDARWLRANYDVYQTYLDSVSAGSLGRDRGMDQLGFWRKITQHPAYDSFWQDQAVDQILSRQPLTVPTMVVSGLWDQEDIYGAMAVYRALEPKDPDHRKLWLVIGPWFHGQQTGHASSLGAIHFGSDTGLYFRMRILAPFLEHYLRDDAPPLSIAPVTAFQTGRDRWQRLLTWPSGCERGCAPKSTPLYLEPGNSLGFQAPPGTSAGESAFDQYVSDPSRPVPFRAHPIQPVGYATGLSWPRWLVDDQRPFSGRTDVLTYQTGVLTKPISVSGRPMVHLVAATSGTDVDWVVKLIDVYPAQVADRPILGGYQLPITMDIFRGRYRTSLSNPQAIQPNVPLLYQFPLTTVDHVFLPGHRIMVQIQSSWFPLYDRNPQTFVPNIFFAKAADYKKARERVYHESGHASFLDLPVIESSAGDTKACDSQALTTAVDR